MQNPSIDEQINLTELGGELRGLKNSLLFAKESAQQSAECAQIAGLEAIQHRTTEMLSQLELMLKQLEEPHIREFTAEEEPIPF